jgi:hypothetical protein
MKTSLALLAPWREMKAFNPRQRHKAPKVNLNYFVFINLSVPCASARIDIYSVLMRTITRCTDNQSALEFEPVYY